MRTKKLFLSFAAAGLTALFSATSAQAYISTGDDYFSNIVNTTNGCVRAYVEGRLIDVAPHTTSSVFFVNPGTRYMVSIFPTRFCGNQAAFTASFGGWDRWWRI